MTTTRFQPSRLTFCTAAVAAAVLLCLVSAPSHAVAPEGKYYLVALLFVNPTDGQPDSELRCLHFLPGEICDVLEDGSENCGTWQFDELQGRQNRWQGQIDVEVDGLPVLVEIIGVTERRGPKTSIGGTVYLSELDLNGGMAGIQQRRVPCREIAATDG